jgi:hypothetical protein
MWAIVPRAGVEPANLSALVSKTSMTTNSITKANGVYGEIWTHDLLIHNQALLPTELHTQYRMLGSNQPRAGYEPAPSTQDLRYIEESSGNDPQSVLPDRIV